MEVLVFFSLFGLFFHFDLFFGAAHVSASTSLYNSRNLGYFLCFESNILQEILNSHVFSSEKMDEFVRRLQTNSIHVNFHL